MPGGAWRLGDKTKDIIRRGKKEKKKLTNGTHVSVADPISYIFIPNKKWVRPIPSQPDRKWVHPIQDHPTPPCLPTKRYLIAYSVLLIFEGDMTSC